jgi:hypothetical protein
MLIKRIITHTTLVFAFSSSIFSQVGIGTASPHTSAELDVTSTTKGLLNPRMTKAQRDAIASPAAGLQVWCTNCASAGELQVFNGTAWTNLIGGVASGVSGTISGLTCNSATNNGALVSGTAASAVSSVIPYTGGSGTPHFGQIVSSTGVTNLTATLTAGTLASGSGTFTYTITGTPASTGTASFAINIGGQTCTLTRTVFAVGSITSLTCGSATNAGTLSAGSAASGVTSAIPYAGGNGGWHNGQTVTSTGVTGLTATVSAGVFASGSGSLTYAISGNPDFEGTASFALNIGGLTCTLTRTVSCMAIGTNTTVVDVLSPTGKRWMDRNLGATRAAISINDQAAYGDLYQWGRLKDGHQCRNATSTTTLSSTDVPGHGDFITNASAPGDWRSPKNDALWQGVNGINNPCPSGYRLPTTAEVNAEIATFSAATPTGAFNSVLKFTWGGGSNYWTGTINGNYSDYIENHPNNVNFYVQDSPYYSERSKRRIVRCIKN